jgi:hypothetical protein
MTQPDTIKVMVRDPRGAPSGYSTEVDWPVSIRIPAAGEMVQVRDERQVWVKEVQWWIDDPEHVEMGLGRVVVQLIVQ